MNNWQFYALLGAAELALLAGAHWTGRLVAAKECSDDKAASGAEATDEMNADAKDQKQGGAAIADGFTGEAARLRREIERFNHARIDDGDACLDADDGGVMHDAYDAVFEKGLHP